MRKSSGLFLASLLLCPAAAAAPPELVLQVLRGEASNNNAISGTAISPAVRVVTPGGVPVAGALVQFQAPSAGASVEFAAYGAVAHVLSNESGVATAPPLKPVVADGPLEIKVTAVKEGQSANASILQMNLGVEGANTQDELEIVSISATTGLRQSGPLNLGPTRAFHIRVEDGSGKPVAGAQTQITMQVITRAGKVDGIDLGKAVSGPDGHVGATISQNTGQGVPEVVVKASLNGRYATRYFILNTPAAGR
jgi:hypothetical protein